MYPYSDDSDSIAREVILKAIPIYYPKLIGKELEFIGQGSYARAYRIGELSFKLTSDSQDALASVRVKDKNLQHIVKVDKVLRASNKYLIVSEYLPLRLQQTDKYQGLFDILEDISYDIKDVLYYNHSEYIDIVNYSDYLTDEVQDEVVLFLEELKKYKFTNADAHDDNVMVGVDGKFKLLDLGHYTSKNEDIHSLQLETIY